MAEKRGKGNLGKWLRRGAAAALVLLLMAVIYVAVVLLQPPGETDKGSFVVQEEDEKVTRMQAAQMNDAAGLAALFGAPLPFLPGEPAAGQGTNASYDGETARVATLTCGGLTISGVRPAKAAPLLLRGELSVSLRSDLTVLNLPAVLASRGNARCVYVSDETAAYAIYSQALEEDAFFSALKQLSWTN